MLWLCDPLSEATAATVHDFISSAVSHVHYGCIIPLTQRDWVVLVSYANSRVWHVLSSYIQQRPRDLWGSLMALLTSDPGNLNGFLPALFSHGDTLKIVSDTLCL